MTVPTSRRTRPARSRITRMFLLAYVVPIVLLAKQIAVPIDYGIGVLGAPGGAGRTAGGGADPVAGIAGRDTRGARQSSFSARSISRSGTALSSISLTIPAVLIIGLLTERTIVLGLDAANTVLLLLTLVVSMLTFALARTNVLLGAVHLLLFVAYLMLIFDR